VVSSLADHVHHLPVANFDDVLIVNLQGGSEDRSVTWRGKVSRVGGKEGGGAKVILGHQQQCRCGCSWWQGQVPVSCILHLSPQPQPALQLMGRMGGVCQHECCQVLAQLLWPEQFSHQQPCTEAPPHPGCPGTPAGTVLYFHSEQETRS
jgi:hypothetical protein